LSSRDTQRIKEEELSVVLKGLDSHLQVALMGILAGTSEEEQVQLLDVLRSLDDKVSGLQVQPVQTVF
jgi:hypothetical protein